MAGKLQQEIRQTKAIRLLEEEVSLNIIRTADFISARLMEVLKPFALSGTQYNVLRILRGAAETGVSCKDVACRMVTPDPDITRLMDRLESRGYLTRGRAKEDRRVVTHRITESGLELLRELDRPIDQMNRRLMQHMKPERLRELVTLLEEVRSAS